MKIKSRKNQGMSLVESMLVLTVAMALTAVALMSHRNYMQKVYVDEAVSLAKGMNRGIVGISNSLERYNKLISENGITEQSARSIFDERLFDADGFLSYQYGQVDVRSITTDRYYDAVGIGFKDAPGYFCAAITAKLYEQYDQIRIGEDIKNLRIVWRRGEEFDPARLSQECQSVAGAQDAKWVQFIKKAF